MLTRLACALVAAVVLAGCGEDRPKVAQAPVKLEITAPADGAVVRDAVVEVSGRVRPASAAVTVGGVPAAVHGGEFSVRVPLEEGANVLDVAATAPGSTPALTALRVTRDVLITIPDLIGRPADQAEVQLRRLGLQTQEEHGGGILEPLLPGSPKVCDTDPRGGAEVRRGAQVRVLVAKDC
jgi:Glucodextranase, domain B/PASTA domain